MRRLAAIIALCMSAGACVPVVHETAAVACTDYIGTPISSRIAALGPPRSVYRIDASRVGYVFETAETRFVGGEPYYTVNYMVGSERHHAPIVPVTTACTGTFVALAPSDAVPVSRRIIVDVLPVR